MKRQKFTRKALLGAGAMASVFALSGCEDKVDATVFATSDDCKANPPRHAVDWALQCDKAFADAEDEHQKLAPRYESKELCEDQHGAGQCEMPETATENGSGSFFSPFMMGYMMSSMWSRPLYASQSGTSALTSNGKSIGNFASGKTFQAGATSFRQPTKSAAPKVMTKSSIARSGGFGASRSGSRGFGG